MGASHVVGIVQMKPRRPTRENGTAAVELAIIVVMATTIIPFIFLFGRVFWHYNVLKQATYDAAQYVATSATSRMMANSADVQAAAVAMVNAAAQGAGMEPLAGVAVLCMPKVICQSTNAGTIQVHATARVTDAGFIMFNMAFLNYDEFEISATAEVPYAGRLATP